MRARWSNTCHSVRITRSNPCIVASVPGKACGALSVQSRSQRNVRAPSVACSAFDCTYSPILIASSTSKTPSKILLACLALARTAFTREECAQDVCFVLENPSRLQLVQLLSFLGQLIHQATTSACESSQSTSSAVSLGLEGFRVLSSLVELGSRTSADFSWQTTIAESGVIQAQFDTIFGIPTGSIPKHESTRLVLLF
eukprot:GABV01009195.1.p1 GENE.GABV01009195.1~~GABV01009195.1.p1  ORF type:complete len:199 (-),score=21.13 GABV01009195.1:97-693(-)